MNEFKIIIPAKGASKRCPGKNDILLPITLKYVNYLGLNQIASVMTECEKIAKIANLGGISVMDDELTSNEFSVNFSNTVKKYGLRPDDPVILLEPTKPCREVDLLRRCVDQYRASGNRVITGLTNSMPQIIIDGDTIQRQTCHILDGSIVIAKVSEFDVPSMNDFWNSNVKCDIVWHDAPNLDFDHPSDLEFYLPVVERFVKNGILVKNG